MGLRRGPCAHLHALGLGLLLAFTSTRGAWIDPDTDVDAAGSLQSYHTGTMYDLVMSDEFNRDGRSFDDGEDPKWTAINKNDYTNAALHYYSKDKVTANDGFLNITTSNEDVTFKYWDDKKKRFQKDSKVFSTGMVQGWNKFCFNGGVVEASIQLPGDAFTGGMWPAAWLLGNLARATYTSSSDYQWPWSYDKCNREDEIHANFQVQQETSSCNSLNHYGFHKHQGRGAPEIDILEAMPGYSPKTNDTVGKPYISTSLQVSPGVPRDRPVNGMKPVPGLWYEDDLEYGDESALNEYFYGTQLKHTPKERTYWADAISANTRLANTHFKKQHIYRVEWESGDSGYIRWYVDGEFTFGMTAETLRITGAKIPDEPMYLLFNTAVSSMWGFPAPCNFDNCSCDCWDPRVKKCLCAIPDGMDALLPAYYLIDWVRVYQNPNNPNEKVGCDTDTHPTAKWIEGHADVYKDPDEDHVLLPVKKGGGHCKGENDCGMGQCLRHRCRY
ncbi:unnamed protein product [Chrysoparadoxa australica]